VYDAFYQLTSDPFCLSPDHRFCHRHRSFAKARAYLHFALQRGEGFVMITGAPGTGKTTLVNQLMSEAQLAHVTVACLQTTQLGADDLLQMVAYAFQRGTDGRGKACLLHQLETFLRQQRHARRRALLIIDEAQDLSIDALEEVRLLTNFEHEGRPLLQVFLIGQEQLRDKLGAPELLQLQQRMIAHAHLDPMSAEETAAYIAHRLHVAKWSGDPQLDDDAIREIFVFSHGVPRRVNHLCSRLFLFGMVEGRRRLDVNDVHSVLGELREEALLPRGDEALFAARYDPARSAPARPLAREPAHDACEWRDDGPRAAPAVAHRPLFRSGAPSAEPSRPLRDDARGGLANGGAVAALRLDARPIAATSARAALTKPVVHVALANDANARPAPPDEQPGPRRAAQVHELRPARAADPPVQTEPTEPAAADPVTALDDALSRARFKRRMRHQWQLALVLFAFVLGIALYAVNMDVPTPTKPGADPVRTLSPVAATPDFSRATLAAAPPASVTADEATMSGEPRGGMQDVGAELRGQGLAITPTDTGFAIDPGEAATFAFRSASLNDALRDTLDRVVAATSASDDVLLRVIGHADASGGAAANREVSRNRADSVVRYLTRRGIPPLRIRAEARGAEQLRSATAQYLNRRVELLIEPARDAPP
jgi:type II secretory pathway predicted ATPase ExeA/outer membrane protein OmpA-like peptidoglycan-associated protein